MAKTVRRKGRLPQPSSSPLFIVAGLPKATAVGAERLLRSGYRGTCNALQLAAGSSDSRLYHRDYVKNLVKTVAQFARKRRVGTATTPITPAFLYLLYVPTFDAEALLQAFDFAVFPIPLSRLAIRNERGQMLRHVPSAVAEALAGAARLSKGSQDIDERLKTARPGDAILLPPINFHADKHRRMADLFLETRQGKRLWNDRFSELRPREFNSETLASLKGTKTQHCFQDHRRIVFFKPHQTAYHGGQWENDEIDAESGARLLRALYRFGAPIPQGFQHDAQFENRRLLKNQEFDCAEKGRILVSGSHANVYPNDFVRAEKVSRK